jgi:hypothetical protein
MNPIFKLISKDKPVLADQRKQLIRDTMRFLLQRDEKRFSRQLLAQLLEEGCNYPLSLAKSRFYAWMIPGLAEKLDAAKKKELAKRLPEALSDVTHVHFGDAIHFYLSHLKHPEAQMAMQVIECLEKIKNEWRLDAAWFTVDFAGFNHSLEKTVEKFSESKPTHRLSALPMSRIRQRVYIALTTSLLKYISEPIGFQSRFGSVPEAITAMQTDHTVFCRAMAFFKTQTPYFAHLASQTFWRTLQNMNTEKT